MISIIKTGNDLVFQCLPHVQQTLISSQSVQKNCGQKTLKIYVYGGSLRLWSLPHVRQTCTNTTITARTAI